MDEMSKRPKVPIFIGKGKCDTVVYANSDTFTVALKENRQYYVFKNISLRLWPRKADRLK